MKIYICILVIITVILCNCKSVDEDSLILFSEGPLFGMVYDSESLPVSGARVILDDQKSAQTDINGRIFFTNVSRGDHFIVIRKDGFEEVEISFNFSSRDQVLYTTLSSLKKILDNLEEALKAGKIADARILASRAEIINSASLRYRYLKVVFLSEVREYLCALDEIILLKDLYPDDFSLSMTQAKILFYGLNNKAEALAVLQNLSDGDISEECNKLIKKMALEPDSLKTVEDIIKKQAGGDYE